MDIYQCMTCGEKWPHGGSHASFVAVAQHADTTRGNPEGMHYVLIGERQHLAQLYERHKAGEPLVMPNDNPVPHIPAPLPESAHDDVLREGEMQRW